MVVGAGRPRGAAASAAAPDAGRPGVALDPVAEALADRAVAGVILSSAVEQAAGRVPPP
jgi:hypothetical protein